MRWNPGNRSDNIEDRRDDSSSGGGMRLGGGGVRLGLGGIVVLFVLSIVFKRDFFSLLSTDTGSYSTPSATGRPDAALDAREEPKVQFVSFVLDDTQATWRRIFPSVGGQYRDAKLVLFRDAIDSACGSAQAASGPFYCPEDQKVYIDLSFYDELKQRFGASGDFAQAYVLAHEIGHHVQNLMGINEKVTRAQRENPGSAKQLSVMLELQADCFAGVWGNSTQKRNILEPGDVEEALNAASAIGDDRLQRMSTGRVNPESFTHGSSEQRMTWFRRGFDSGSPSACNTFAD